jgi:hypothetical protein
MEYSKFINEIPILRLALLKDWDRVSPVILVFLLAFVILIFGIAFSFLRIFLLIGLPVFLVYFLFGAIWFKNNF